MSSLSAFEQVELQKELAELKAENEALRKNQSNLFSAVGILSEENDDLQLRVASLVEALNTLSATTGEYLLFTAKSTDLSREYHKAREALSATPQEDQAWLMDQKADAIEDASDCLDGGERDCNCTRHLYDYAAELRQSKGEEA